MAGSTPTEQLFSSWVTGPDRDLSAWVTRSCAPSEASPSKKMVSDIRYKFFPQHRPVDEPVDEQGGVLAGDFWHVPILRIFLPVPPPSFLATPNCQLLSHMRACIIKHGMYDKLGTALERMKEANSIEPWIHLSQGGVNSPPCINIHGRGMYLTVHEGPLGIGWISNPTTSQRHNWMDDLKSIAHLTRYVVLTPGQTIWLPPGIIHFMFRAQDSPTLATGGYVLQWSGVKAILSTIWEYLNVYDVDIRTRASLRLWTVTIKDLVDTCTELNDLEHIGGPKEAHDILKSIASKFLPNIKVTRVWITLKSVQACLPFGFHFCERKKRKDLRARAKIRDKYHLVVILEESGA